MVQTAGAQVVSKFGRMDKGPTSVWEAPNALFVTGNRLTIGAVSAINNKGLRCPEDVSVVGFDNYEWQEAFRPRLTTLAQPAYTMGHRAAQLLLARILGDKKGPPEEVVLNAQLIVRESCGIYRANL